MVSLTDLELNKNFRGDVSLAMNRTGKNLPRQVTFMNTSAK